MRRFVLYLTLGLLVTTASCGNYFSYNYTYPLSITFFGPSFDGSKFMLVDQNMKLSLLSIQAGGIEQRLSYQLNSSIYWASRPPRFNSNGEQIMTLGAQTFSVLQITPTTLEPVWSISVGVAYSLAMVFSDFSRIYSSMNSDIYRLDSFNGSSYASTIETFPPRKYRRVAISEDMEYIYVIEGALLYIYTLPTPGEPLLVQ